MRHYWRFTSIPRTETGVPTLFQVKMIPAFFNIGKMGKSSKPLPHPADPGVEYALLKALTE
jgi:hypothetical protein